MRTPLRIMSLVFLLLFFVEGGTFFGGSSLAAPKNEGRTLLFITFGEHPPYHSEDVDGELVGFDLDVAEAMSRQLGQPIVVRVVANDEVIPMVLDGTADAIIGITETREGKKIFDYTSPYLRHKTRLFIHEGTEFIRKVADLRGLRVGVRQGFDVEEYLRIVPGITLLTEPTAESGLQNLLDRVTTVYIGDEYESDYAIQKNRMRGVVTLGGVVLTRKRSIAVKKGNTQLLNDLNQAVRNLEKDMTLQVLKDQSLARRIVWARSTRWSVLLLLIILVIIAIILLIAVIWNHRLAEAVDERTRQVEAEHEHFENIFNYASDGIVILDPETTHVMESNPAFEEILGYTPEELKDLALSDLDATDDKNFANQVHRAHASVENILFEAKLFNKTQAPVDLVIHAQNFPYKGKRVIEAIARDVTELKKLESMKDTILQDVAHELKTPMAKIAMSLDLLEKKFPQDKKEELSKHFDVCHRSIVRLQDTIEGILSLSRLETYKPQVAMEPFALQEVIHNVIQELQIFADRKGIGLVDEMLPEAVLVRGDVEMIRRLFINLIHNAIKFTQKGSVTVYLEADEQFAKTSIQDTGLGIEKEDLTKVFGRFYQKSPAYEGSGVGLTISEKIVSFHNGVIWAESAGAGKGTTVNVLFPLYKDSQEKRSPEGRA